MSGKILQLKLVAAVAVICLLCEMLGFAQETNTPPPTPPLKSETKSTDLLWTKEGSRNLVAAFVVGSLGAGAFFFAVLYGFIFRETRDRVLEFLSNKSAGKIEPLRSVVFCAFGGVIASVFQAAQPSVFAPIQAFVLGATWPSVVTRIMSGSNGHSGLAELAKTPGSQIPTPKTSATLSDAQVFIKPKPPQIS